MDCDGVQSDSVRIEVTVQVGATVIPSTVIVLPTPGYGTFEQVIEVISENGKQRETYKVIIEKRIPWEGVLMQKYDNVVFVNNNPKTNGGYVFEKYQWYKNGQKVAEKQFFSEGPTLDDKLDPNAEYYAVLYTKNGKVFTTCPMGIQQKHHYGLVVYPNPVAKNQPLNIQFDYPVEQFTTTAYTVYNALGQFMMKGQLEQPHAVVDLPLNLATGSYILVLKVEGEYRSVRFVMK